MKKIRWTSTEDEHLRNYYNNPNLDVIEIGRLMNRSPGGVLSRLERIRIIPHKAAARGYKLVKKMSNKKKEPLLITNDSQNKKEIAEICETIDKNEQNQNSKSSEYLSELLMNEYNIVINHSENINQLLTDIGNEIEIIEDHMMYMNVISLLLHKIEKEKYNQIQIIEIEKSSRRSRSNSV